MWKKKDSFSLLFAKKKKTNNIRFQLCVVEENAATIAKLDLQPLTKAKVKRPNIRVIETGLTTACCGGEGNVEAVAAMVAAAAPAPAKDMFL